MITLGGFGLGWTESQSMITLPDLCCQDFQFCLEAV